MSISISITQSWNSNAMGIGQAVTRVIRFWPHLSNRSINQFDLFVFMRSAFQRAIATVVFQLLPGKPKIVLLAFATQLWELSHNTSCQNFCFFGFSTSFYGGYGLSQIQIFIPTKNRTTLLDILDRRIINSVWSILMRTFCEKNHFDLKNR